MTDKTIENASKVGGDYFSLMFSRRSSLHLKDFLTFDFNDYHCLKGTGMQRLINYEDFLDFKYSKYCFFKKEKYDIKPIMDWCNFIKPLFLHRPVPPFNPNKIIIK